MKRTLIFAILLTLTAGVTHAQTVKMATETEKSTAKKTLRSPKKTAPNEVTLRKVSYSGVLPQLGKTDNPAKLVDPRAPQEAGKAEDNTAIDPIDKKPRGIIFLRLRW